MLECAECQASFRTRGQLSAHYEATGHRGLWLYCDPCNRVFETGETLDAHLRTSMAHPIVYNGNSYSRLNRTEQAEIAAKLPARCHTLDLTRLSNKEKKAAKADPANFKTRTLLPTPPANPNVQKRTAVVLDCEMAGTENGNTVVTISVVDLLTGETLIDNFIKPSEKVTDWRKKWTGISERKMLEQVAQNRALDGMDAALAKLWEFVDDSTILIGHALDNDLKALKINHEKIIDTAIITAGPINEANNHARIMGLEPLCKELLDIRIRQRTSTGRKGRPVHNSLEDAMATRELLLWCLKHPDEQKAWSAKNLAPFPPQPKKPKEGPNKKQKTETSDGQKEKDSSGKL